MYTKRLLTLLLKPTTDVLTQIQFLAPGNSTWQERAEAMLTEEDRTEWGEWATEAQKAIESMLEETT